MTSQTIQLNFNDLKNLSSIETVHFKNAIEVTLSFEACEVSEQEILNTWCTKLFQSYGPTGITYDLNTLLEFFSKAIQELLDECGNCENDEQIQRLDNFLTYFSELFTWIHTTASEFETNKITFFVCFGMLSIENYLVTLSKPTSQVAATKLIEKSLQVHTIIITIITSHPKIFNFQPDNIQLKFLISQLCAVGEIVPKLDIKTAVETWKCITRLVSQHSFHTKFGDDDDVWVAKPMSFLIKEIGRNVQTVYTQNSLSEPIQQIEKYLKVTNFYLRLLQKLLNDFRHFPFPISEEFIRTLAIVFNPPIYIVGTPVYKVIMDSIGNDLKELVPLAYRNQKFVKDLLCEHFEHICSRESIQEIVLLVLEVILMKDEPQYINEAIFDLFLLKYVSNGYLIAPDRVYNRFVEMFSTLHLRFAEERIIKKLVLTILGDNTMRALAAIDIWCTIFIQSEDSVRQSHMQFWIEMNQKIATFSTNHAALHTELLLRNLYTLLSTDEKNNIFKNTNACIRNERLFLSLGLDAIPCSPVKQSIIKHFQKEIFRLLTKSESELTIEGYYTIVKDLKLLKSIDFKNNEVTDLLVNHLEIALEDKKLYLMVESILNFLNIDNVDGNRLQRILGIIRMNISLFEELSTKMCFVRFVNTVSKQARFENISKEILNKYKEDHEIKSFRYLEVRNSRFKEDREESCEKLWQEIIANRKSVVRSPPHICGVVKVTPLEKIDNTQELLVALENSIDKLQAQQRNVILSKSNSERIQRSIRKLKGMIYE